MNSIVGDSDSRILVEADGTLRIAGSHSSFEGKVGIGVSHVREGVQLETTGSVKLQGKKFEVGNDEPTVGLYHKGDIVWNDDPKPAGILGWICIRTGTPGEWRPFGNIEGNVIEKSIPSLNFGIGLVRILPLTALALICSC